jgi:hypothetical protein
MHVTKRLEKELFFDVALYLACIASISLLYRNIFVLTIVLATASVTGKVFWYKRHDFYFYVTGAFLGPAAEIVCIYFGVWRYANPSFLGIPAWLPFIWGLSAMMIKRIAEIFVSIKMK